MQYSIPQFIETEDKIIGPLTLKQFLWILGAGGVLTAIWISLKDVAVFVIASIPILMLFGSLAFVKINGRPLSVFLAKVTLYIIRPNLYIWKREYEKETELKLLAQKNGEKKVSKKDFTQSKIEELAWVLDTGGSTGQSSEKTLLNETNLKLNH